MVGPGKTHCADKRKMMVGPGKTHCADKRKMMVWARK
jgi:hypothetical protein